MNLNVFDYHFDCRVRDLADRRCPGVVPRVPMYAFVDPSKEDDSDDAMVEDVKVAIDPSPAASRSALLKHHRRIYLQAHT
uniref:Uncharacterized protein n=1 Tax=Leersia perrieri TaxID=77586 RepID=A0A0D9WF43_9ORYZ